VHALALAAEQAEDLDSAVPGAAEPVRMHCLGRRWSLMERLGNPQTYGMTWWWSAVARRGWSPPGCATSCPSSPGVRERWGKDLLHCPYCHGYEVRDQPLGVLGTHPRAVGQALLVRQWSEDVAFFPHTLELAGEERERLTARGVAIVDGVVKCVVVDGDGLRAVELADGQVVARSAVFVVPRMVPHDGLLTGLGCTKDEDGWVIADASGRTSVPGVWAAGNLADPRAQVVTAAGMGSAAAIAVNHDLVDEEVARAVDHHRTARASSRPAG
jgi:Pyridine nucleotide-disulphide oxidoreductase